MRNEVSYDLGWSAKAFLSLVWPVIRPALGGGQLMPVEGVATKPMQVALDTLAGIDAWHIGNNGLGIRGIASRVQADTRAWDTFTIRYRRASGAETEYTKRLAAMDSTKGWLYPHITIQAYLSHDKQQLLSCAVIRTEDLFRYAAAELGRDRGRVYMQTVHSDGNTFIVVPWGSLRADGIEMFMWEKGETQHA